MGIKNLIKVVQKYAPNAITFGNIMNYKGKVLAIDANLMIYKVTYAIRKNGYDLKNNDTIVTHIHGMMQKLVAFNKYNIKPIFVFDSAPHRMKEHTIKDRKKLREKFVQKYDEAITQDEKKKYFYIKSGIKENEINDIIELINVFNYPIIEAAEEADAELAYLTKNKLVDAVVTDDMDILVFGGTLILKNFSIAEKRKIQVISLDKLLKDAKLSQNQLIDIAIILGCDYCSSVHGVGPIRSYQLIKEHGSLSNMIKDNVIELNIDYNEVKNYFKNPPINKNSINDIKVLKEKNINKRQLKKYLKEKQFKDKYIDSVLTKIIEINN